jgi:hypothetical protein
MAGKLSTIVAVEGENEAECEASFLYGDATRLVKELEPIAQPDDRRVDGSEHLLHTAELVHATLGFDAAAFFNAAFDRTH